MRGFIIAITALAGMAATTDAAFTGYAITTTTVSGLTVHRLHATFNGATDSVTNAFNLELQSGSGLSCFVHNDLLSSSTGGTWNPQATNLGGAPDSFLTIGAPPGFTNQTISAGWDWNQPCIPIGSIGWMLSGPGSSAGGSQVLLGQFVLSASDTSVRTFDLSIGYSTGLPGAPPLFATDSFTLPTPGGLALFTLGALLRRRRRMEATSRRYAPLQSLT